MLGNVRLSFFSLGLIAAFVLASCSYTNNELKASEKSVLEYPSDVIPSLEKWKILLGDGSSSSELIDFQKNDFFYTEKDEQGDWVVFKTPNSGITSRTSSNTRTELGEKNRWTSMTGGKLTGQLKVMHVSTSGDARVASSYSMVVGQIHSDSGHENEPLKIFYKKFPGHQKGSVFWNYEINTLGENSGRWDYSNAVWGYDMSTVGTSPDVYPEEPQDGITLGETFSYEVNVFEGVMYLKFMSEGHPTKTFVKSLIKSDYVDSSDMPEQVRELYAIINRDGTEQPTAYMGEEQYFKLGAYNQTNGKDPESNMVWSTGAEIYDGDIKKQYDNGSYTEVWFRQADISMGSAPK